MVVKMSVTIPELRERSIENMVKTKKTERGKWSGGTFSKLAIICFKGSGAASRGNLEKGSQ